MDNLSDNKEIKSKIQELFAYRKLTDLFRHAGLRFNRKIITDLYELQFTIYLLDAYLESTWAIEKDSLKQYWTGINLALDPFGISEKQKSKLLEEIVQYERIEKKCRKETWPTEVSFKQFYTTKSCDVRLVRKLLYFAHPELEYSYPMDAWKFYDLITEVNDDISDVYEDLPTFNANRFLVSILRKGHVETAKDYYQFLANVSYQAETFFSNQFLKGENAQLFEWTAIRAVETNTLLNTTVEKLDMTKISTSRLLTKMT